MDMKKRTIALFLCVVLVGISCMPSLLFFSQAKEKATHASYHYINSTFSGTEGSVFALYDDAVSFYEAKQICEDLGGHLATITSDEEEAAVIDMINAVSTTRSGFFIGVHDPKADGHFEYIDGKELSYFGGWGAGEPNNLTNETVGEIFMSTKQWNNSYATAGNRSFICEFDATDKPNTQMRYNGNDYLLFNESVSWTDAQKACERIGGHLVTISDHEENTAVTELIKDNLHQNYWIGLHMDETNNRWAWVTGETLSENSYKNWAAYEPSQTTDAQYGIENVAHIVSNHPKNKKAEGSWNDHFNFYKNPASVFETCKFGFICELEKKVLVFNANEGHFGSDNNSNEIAKELHYNESLRISTPQRTGYSFQGWYDDRTGGTQYSFYSGDYKNVESGTYYAHWKGNEYTVKFNQRDVKNTAELSSIKVVYGETYPVLPTPEPKDSSKEFVCWTDSDGNEINASSVVNKTSDHCLYPRWTEKTSATIKSIAVKTLPDKMDYLVGEKFDPSGLTLTVIYNDLSETEIGFEKCTFENTDFALPGSRTIKISYQEFETEFEININQIERISVRTLPTKTIYEIGESLDATGLSLWLQYKNNDAEEVVLSGFHVEDDNRMFTKSGKYYITVTFKEFDTQFEVYVNKAKVESVEIKTVDGYAVYQNECIDYNKIELCVILTDGNRLYLNPQEVITDISLDSSEIGTQTANVVFDYDGESYSAVLTVDVAEKPKNVQLSKIYSDGTVKCTASDLIKVPVYIECETPLSGLGVTVEFDNEKLRPCSIEYEPGFNSVASVEDSLGGGMDDCVRIIALADYQKGESFIYSGRICTLYFKAKENITAKTDVVISVREKDTFGEDNNPVPFVSSKVRIEISRTATYQDDHANSIYGLDQVKNVDEKLLNVPLYINCDNLSSCMMTVQYDNRFLQPIKIEKSVLLENFTFEYNIIQDEGKIRIAFFGSGKISAAGELLDITFDTERLKFGYTKISMDVNEAGNDANNKITLNTGGFKIAVHSDNPSENRLCIFSFDGSFEQRMNWWKNYSSATMRLGFLIYGCDNAVRYVWSTNSRRVHIDQNGNITNTGCFARSARIMLTAYDADGNVVALSTVAVRFYKFNWQYRRLQSQEIVSDNLFRPTVEPASTESETLVSFVTAYLSKVFGLFIS